MHGVFQLITDDSGTADGVYVDDLRFICRASEYDGDSYFYNEGTSMATPHVAGVAALVRSAVPGATAAQVAQAIRESAVPLPSLQGKTVTGGRADAPGAIAAARRLAHRPPSSPPPGDPRRLRAVDPAVPRRHRRDLRGAARRQHPRARHRGHQQPAGRGGERVTPGASPGTREDDPHHLGGRGPRAAVAGLHEGARDRDLQAQARAAPRARAARLHRCIARRKLPAAWRRRRRPSSGWSRSSTTRCSSRRSRRAASGPAA